MALVGPPALRVLARDARVWPHVSREECVLGSSPTPVASITSGTTLPSSNLDLAQLDSSKPRQRDAPDDGARVPPGAERGSRCPRTGCSPPMKGKLAIGLVAAGLFLAGFGGAVLPASAEPHHFVLNLANGTSLPYTGEPGSAPSTITVAGIAIPVVSVQDLGAVVQQVTPTVATPPPPPAPAPAPAAPAPAQSKPPTHTQPKSSTTPQKQSAQPSRAPSKSSPQPTTTAKPKKNAKASQEPTGGKQTPQATSGKKTSNPRATDGGPKKAAKKSTPPAKPAKKDKKQADDNAAPPPAAHAPPAPSNPTFSLAQPGPAAVGVPNFFIDKFRIPPFLLPIYQAAGVEYGIRWEILAAINEIETD